MQTLRLSLILLAVVGLTSCFTGVESTGKITLSKNDRKNIKPSNEEMFFKPVDGDELNQWEKGRAFMAADNRTMLIFEPDGLPVNPEKASIGGKIMIFEGVESRMSPDGTENALLVFSLNGNTFRFNTGKKLTDAGQSFKSDMIPMMIDMKMVKSAHDLLNGLRLWTKSSLWYDENGQRVPGKKYVPVIVDDVKPGNIIFPLNVKFHDAEGRTAWLMINFGTSGKESRSFENIFSLSDVRQKYPSIEDDNWKLICDGKIAKGMTKEECKLAIGTPSEVESGRDYSQTLDRWHYPDGTVLWFESGILTAFKR